MIQILQENNCCGCAACQAVCPAACITMEEGTLGALFPRVDAIKCLQCGRCEAVCPMLHQKEVKENPVQTVYAAYAKQPQMRCAGSSGGIFGALAEHFMQQGYVVYGAAFDENLKLKCTAATTADELAPLYKSKYLQSDLSQSFAEIKARLQAGDKVLFVSTPCQVAALKRYLGRVEDNLFLVDFLCHGVPSQRFFDQCKNYEEQKRGGKIRAYTFRTKTKNGSTPHYVTVGLDKNDKRKSLVMPYFKSPFYMFFQRYITLRESCYDCAFSEPWRVSDLTIADFHEIERYEPALNRFEGVSTVMCNTARGEQMFKKILSSLWSREFSLDDLMRDGVLFAEKTKRPKARDAFVESYESRDFADFVRLNTNKKRNAIYGVYYKLPRSLRRLVKKICHIE